MLSYLVHQELDVMIVLLVKYLLQVHLFVRNAPLVSMHLLIAVNVLTVSQVNTAITLKVPIVVNCAELANSVLGIVLLHAPVVEQVLSLLTLG